MRIAFLVGAFPALSESFVLNQITGLIDRGHEVDIYAERRGAMDEAHPDVLSYALLARSRFEEMPRSPVRRALRLPGRLLRQPLPARALFRALDARRYGREAASLRLVYAALPFFAGRSYDVIHAHFGASGCRAALLRDLGLVSGRLVTAFHGVDITLYPRLRGRDVFAPLFAGGELFLPISARWNDELVALGCPRERIVVHRMGVDCRRFGGPSAGARGGTPVRLVTTARLVEKKGVEYGLRALRRLLDQESPVEYLVVGDGPLRSPLEGLARELGLGEAVRWLGPRGHGELPRILAESDVFVAPSVTAADGDEEGIPASIMEAMASGLPVVATAHSAIPELVADGVSGFLAPERDAGALASRLAALIADPRLRAAMGRAGRARIETQFDVDLLNDRLVELYAGLLRAETPRR